MSEIINFLTKIQNSKYRTCIIIDYLLAHGFRINSDNVKNDIREVILMNISDTIQMRSTIVLYKEENFKCLSNQNCLSRQDCLSCYCSHLFATNTQIIPKMEYIEISYTSYGGKKIFFKFYGFY